MTILSDKLSFLSISRQLQLISTYFPGVISKGFINSQKWLRHYCYPSFTNEKKTESYKDKQVSPIEILNAEYGIWI